MQLPQTPETAADNLRTEEAKLNSLKLKREALDREIIEQIYLIGQAKEALMTAKMKEA